MEVSDAKWPFFMLTFTLVAGLGLMIARLERSQVMQQWKDRRCEVPVMMAAAFFRPDQDPRSSTAFAADNFEFCMKSVIESFLTLLGAPIHAMFGKSVGAAGDALNAMDGIRAVIQNLHTAFMTYIGNFFKKFYAATFEMSRIVQHVKMALSKLNAVALSMVYAGISLWRGILNFIQFVIRVILIICAILLVLMILLFFVLLPVMPVIIQTLVVIIGSVVAFAGFLDPSISELAHGQMSGFCFAEGTRVRTEEGVIAVEDVVVGTALQGRTVTAVIRMDGTAVPLYDLCGIHVSGSHRVRGTDGIWKLVAEDERAVPIDSISPTLYCFNTTDNIVPVLTASDQVIDFRDWEELSYDDPNGQYIWNYIVSLMLNPGQSYQAWKGNLAAHCEDALASATMPVKTAKGWVPMGEIRLGDEILDREGVPQRVLGVIEEVCSARDAPVWHTEWYEDCGGTWKKQSHGQLHGQSREQLSVDGMGHALITESGEVVVSYEGVERIIRDFTEVGYDRIQETYEFLAARLKKA